MSDAQGLPRLQRRLTELTNRLDEQIRANRRRQGSVWLLGAACVVLIIVGLAGVTRMTRKLDTNALAEIGRAEIERHLPDGRRAVEGYLRAEAPRLVSDAMRSFVALMPRLRMLLVKDLTQKLDVINGEFEKTVVTQMTDAVHKSKAEIDKAWPDATDREKLEKLITAVAKDFNRNVQSATEALYPQYEAEMSRITQYIENLSDGDPSQLSEEERERKEIIETLVRLVQREKNAGK